MTRSVWIWVGILALAGLIGLVVLKVYALEMVHAVVMNAVEQKAPDGYPKARIEKAFADRLASVSGEDARKEYMAQLLSISHRLEKIQLLEKEEVETLLNGLNP